MLTPGIWTAMYHQESLADAIGILHRLGWRAFECSSEHVIMIDEAQDQMQQIEAAKTRLHDLGCEMPQGHAFLAANVAHPDKDKRQEVMAILARHLSIFAQLGVENVVIHPGRGAGHSTAAEREAIMVLNVKNYRRLGDQAAALGLRIGIENMPQRSGETPLRLGVHPEELLELLERIDHPAVGITIDTDHTQLSGLDTAAVIRQLGPHIVATHISDCDGGRLSHRTPGVATIDWHAVMAAFADIGYEGIFNLEIPGERHPIPEITALKIRHAREVTEWLVAQVNEKQE